MRLVLDTNVLISALLASGSLPAHLIVLNEIRDLAVVLNDLPLVTASPDPHDNYLLAMAASGSADFLVTGDKRDLLALRLFEGTRIITVREFLILLRRMPGR